MRWKISCGPHAAGTDRENPERCRRSARLPKSSSSLIEYFYIVFYTIS
nr:MAG TPA: hypothetical protein [Caudoviricetes sp.]